MENSLNYLAKFIEGFNFSEENNSDLWNLNLQFYLIVFDFITFLTLFFIPAYYGRYNNNRKTFMMFNDTFAWIFQESPNVFITLFYIFYLIGNKFKNFTKEDLIKIGYLSLFLFHYIHRTFIFPLKLQKSKEKKWPVEISLMAFGFCVVNSLLINRSIIYFINLRNFEENFFSNMIGICLFFIGFYINVSHDYYILNKKNTVKGYFLPEYFLFNYISCPNYFGEFIEWIGFAILTKTFSSWLFAFSTFTNLFPRSLTHHKWYKNKFEDYPKERKAFIPYIIQIIYLK